MKHIYHSIFVLLFFSSTSFAQDPGDYMFDASILHEVEFEFTESNYYSIMESNYQGAPENGPVPYLMAKVTIDGEVIDSVGVRFKGFTSYTEENKKPIKIDFNEFVKGKKYDGLKKLNLNNGTADPSLQRDVICYDLMRNTGVIAPRTSYSKVYFNGEYWGLYQSIEQVDKVFLKTNFSNGKGNLFKNKGWSHFEWLGNSPNSYHPPFQLKTNEDGDDWSGFVNLMDVLNNTSDSEFPEAIEEVFNVDLFLKTLAVDVATNNWDSYLQHGRNWYIYEDTTSGIFNWIPWDYNLALGGSLFGGGDCFIFAYYYGITDGTKTVQFFDASFAFGDLTYTWDFGDGNFSNDKDPIHTFEEEGLHEVCLTIMENDSCYNDICMTINTTDDLTCESQTNGSCPHPADGYFFQIVEWIPSCCEIWGEDCEEAWIEITGGPGNNFQINQQENEGVLIQRLLNVPEFNNRYYQFFCDLMKYEMTEEKLFATMNENYNLVNEAVEADNNFLYSYERFKIDIGATNDSTGLKKVLTDRIDGIYLDLAELITCPTYISDITANNIVINEIMAVTNESTTITDPNGEKDDWVEFFNNTADDIELTGTYFSDDAQDLKKWQFPTGTIIPADGYLIVWADGHQVQPGIHTNFKLNNDGEELFLSNTDGSIINSMTFEAQTANIAYARIPNGKGDFVFQGPTHNFNNEDVMSIIDEENEMNISLYPVPSSSYLEINIQNTQITHYQVNVYSITGTLIYQEKHSATAIRIDVSEWNDGFYFLQIVDDRGHISDGKFVVAK